jgi:demethylmenaquinone methyltransferase/2-methoxy-6-polyprenyl-1,4-benzoquinol methylase
VTTTQEQPRDPGFRDLDRSAGFDEIVAALDHFNSSPYVKAARRELYRLLRPRPGSRLLDAGCGLGVDIAALAPRVRPGGAVVGLDLSERMLGLARQRYGEVDAVEFKAGSVESIPFPDGTFDGAFAMRTLQYLNDPAVGVRELARVTRPGGRVVLVEGGLSAADLPDTELNRRVFGPRGRSLGLRGPALLREAGLNRIVVRPGFAFEMGVADPGVVAYAQTMAEIFVDEGTASEAEVADWLASFQAILDTKTWFAVDLMLVVAGTVPTMR